jgi:uncharacterized protein YndB with AHSA1/START domain
MRFQLLIGFLTLTLASTLEARERCEPDRVATTVEVTIDRPVDEVFKALVAEDVLPKILKKYGPIPGVIATRVIDGPWERAGASRYVFTEGGGSVHETITDIDPARSYHYQIDDFHNPLKDLANNARGTFLFEARGAQTRVRWTYSFARKSPLTRPILGVFVHVFYRGFMKQALAESKKQLEAI